MEINQNKRLGRGLSALLGENNKKDHNHKLEIDSDEDIIQNINTRNIIAGIYQPRKHFDREELEELSNSIKENGLIQPIILRKADDEGIFEIIAGERRFKAAKMANLDKIPAIIKNISNSQALEFAIIENVQRSDLSIIEEAKGYRQLMDEFDYTQDQISKKIGCSRSHIANILRLLSLPTEVQEMLDHKKISIGHAKAIINSDDVVKIAKKIFSEGLTVREAEELVKSEKPKKEKVTNKNKTQKPDEKNYDLNLKLRDLFKVSNVKIESNNKGKGKITIKFNNIKDIEKALNNIKFNNDKR